MGEPSAGEPRAAAATAVQPGDGVGWGSAPTHRRRRRGSTGPLPGQHRLRAPWSRRLVLGDALQAVREVLRRLPRVVVRGVAPPAHQVLGPATEGLAVEERLHDS
jgi:hypothetical protein